MISAWSCQWKHVIINTVVCKIVPSIASSWTITSYEKLIKFKPHGDFCIEVWHQFLLPSSLFLFQGGHPTMLSSSLKPGWPVPPLYPHLPDPTLSPRILLSGTPCPCACTPAWFPLAPQDSAWCPQAWKLSALDIAIPAFLSTVVESSYVHPELRYFIRPRIPRSNRKY